MTVAAAACEGSGVIPVDIWWTANLLIGQHGAGTASGATRRARSMLDRGDRDGWHVMWMYQRRAAMCLVRGALWVVAGIALFVAALLLAS